MGNSHSKTQLKTQLKTAVKEGRWSDAFSLLADDNYSKSAVEHFIKYCDKYGINGEFSLADIKTEERDALLKTAVRGRQWNVVHHVLKVGVSHETCVWVIEEACKTAYYKDYKDYILPYVDHNFLSHCSTEQLDTLLTTATTNGRWFVVKMLHAGGSHSQRIQIIEHACKTANVLKFKRFILEYVDIDFMSHCSTEQLDTLLTTATKRGLWHMVCKLLKADLSYEKRVWVLEQACKTASHKDLKKHILQYVDDDFLTYCSTEQLDTLLITATTNERWDFVKKLCACGSHSQRLQIIEHACKTVDDWQFQKVILQYVDDNFLSQCSAETKDTLLTTATTQGLWNMVHKMLKTGVSHKKHVWVIEEACKTINYRDFKLCILSNVDDDFLSRCNADQLDTLLTTATRNGRWYVVKMLLCAGGSHSQRIQIIEHACKTADYIDFQAFILQYVDDDVLSQCITEQLNTLLTTATARGLWHMVHKVLKVVVSNEKSVWSIDQACKTAAYVDFRLFIWPHVDDDFLSHCSSEQVDTLLTTATTRGLWHMVRKLLKTFVSHEKRVWVIQQACKTADNKDFEDCILPYVDHDFLSNCNTEQLDTLLPTATTRGLWHMVHKVLGTVDSHKKRVWVIKRACNTAQYDDFKCNILPFVDHGFLAQCSTKQLGILLRRAATRNLWHMVDKVLEAGGSHKMRVWVIETAVKTADYKDFKDYVLPHIDDDFLKTATTLGLWPVLQKVLTVSSSHKQKALIIEEACETAGYVDFRQYILQYVDSDFLSQCSAETTDTLLTTATMRGLWHMVHKVLKVISHEKRVWVIEEACETASYRDFRLFILQHVDSDFLSHCNAETLDTLLTTATISGLWHMVHKLLEVVGNHEKRVWVIEQACESADHRDLIHYILPHVHGDFLSQCTAEQFETLLTTATTRGLWHMVQKLLKVVDCHAWRVEVVKQACKTADFSQVETFILPHVHDDFPSLCSTEQLDTLLTTATTRGLWHIVCTLLETPGNHEKRVWVIEQACKTAGYTDFNAYILSQVDDDFLSQCTTDQLHTMLTKATTRGLWYMVYKLLTVVGSHEKHVWVIEQACKTANFSQFLFFILPHVQDDFLAQCNTEQLDTLLTTATTRGLWHLVNKVLKVVDCHEKRVWVIDQACKTATYNHFKYNILQHVDGDFLSHCSTELLDSWLTTATTRSLWHMVEKVLKAGGSHEKRAWVIETAVKTADYKDFKDYVLPHIDDDFLTTATTLGLWPVLQKVLTVSSSHKQKALIIEEACETAGYWDFRQYILQYVDSDFLSHCSAKTTDTLLTTATMLGLWHMVHKVLEVVISHEKRVWVIEEACETASYRDFRLYILEYVDSDFLSHCNAETLDTLLTTATTGGLLHMVHKMLEAVGNHEKRVWVIEVACKTADYKDYKDYILPYVDHDFLSKCNAEQLDTFLTTATTRGLWHMVHKVLGTVDTHEKRIWVIEEAYKTAYYKDYKDYILSYVDHNFLSKCNAEQLNTFLTTATTRGLWDMVHKLFETVSSHEKRVWVIKQACHRAAYQEFEDYILPHVDSDFLSHCSTEQLDTLLTTATTWGLWHMVHKLLKTGVSHEKRVWVIEQARRTADNKNFKDYILPQVDSDFLSHCNTQQLGTLLTTATTHGLWHMVHKLLETVDSHAKRVWVIEEACKTADYREYEDYILPYVDHNFLSKCNTEQLDTLLTTATTRGLWHMVHRLFEIVSSHEKRVWVIKQACKTAAYKTFEDYILPHVDSGFLSHCSTEELDTFLTTATTRGLWHMVHKLLETVDSHEKRVWILVQACKTADYEDHKDILPYVDSDFLSQCSTEVLCHFLTTATTNGRCFFVKRLLCACGSHSQRLQIIEHACKTFDFMKFQIFTLEYVDDDFLSHCSTENLDNFLTTATTRGLWHMVHKLLEVGVSHKKRVWVIEQACKTAAYETFKDYILPFIDHDFLSHCSTEQLDTLLTTATTTALWHMVHKLCETVSSHEKRVWVIEQACKTAEYKEFKDDILPHVDSDYLSQCTTEQLDTLLTTATTRNLWHMVHKILKAGVSHEKRIWVVEQACKTAEDKDFNDYILPYVEDNFLSQCNIEKLNTVPTVNNFNFPNCILLVDGDFLTTVTIRCLWSMVHTLLKSFSINHEKRVWVIEQACKTADYKDFEEYILPHFDVDFLSHCSTEQLDTLLTGGFQAKMYGEGLSAQSRLWALSEACKCFTYTTVMNRIKIAFGISNVRLLISSLPSNKLPRDAQSVALRLALQEHRWDVISRASLSHVWEQVRRHLFREAVYQKQWTLVKKWADHTLYDDERWWALEESYKQKQWDVMLRLADHGLTEIELMRVRYRLAKHADWDVVLQMFERGVDVTEVREMVETVMLSRKAKADEEKHCALVDRWWQLRQLEEKLIHASATRITLPSTASQWESVLFHLHRHPGTVSVRSRSQPSKTFGGLLLQRAIKQRAWHVVMHLVTLGMATSQLDSLLTDMIRRRQWGVCRAVLEQGVGIQSCLRSLFVFMEMNQWMLVARVMEFIVDDSLKHQVEKLAFERCVGSLVWQCVSAMCRVGMCVGDALRLHVIQRAMERREGSVVGECISTMELYHPFAKEREELFQQAISRGVLQAVKPLVEEKDETEIQHRDTVLLAAIEQRQWDVVDCCQLQGADIDMKDEHGETPLIREVRNVEWKAVEELVVRGADPNVLDRFDYSVLNRAIEAKQWDIVPLLIEYHADIHKASPLKPLNMLIDERQGEIINHTLIWCPDQAKGVSDKGETTLHAIALDERPENPFYYQIVRGVSPLTLTKEGHSVLLYAVGNDHCPQKMVAECIRLGFSTHQPRPSALTAVDLIEYVTDGLLNGWKMHEYYGMYTYRHITSPFLLAVLRGMPAVAHMLYESGSCTSTELQRLYKMLLDLLDPRTEAGRTLLEGEHVHGFGLEAFNKYQEEYTAFVEYITTFLPYLNEMASTPRSLVSTCRLVISHSITVRKRHERDVQDLFMTDRMKNYLLFSDLTDPDYQPSMYGRCHHTELRNKKELELEQWMKKTYDKILKDLEGTDPSEVH